jgi:hypothetical protein
VRVHPLLDCPACDAPGYNFVARFVPAGNPFFVNSKIVRLDIPVMRERCAICGYEYFHEPEGQVEP